MSLGGTSVRVLGALLCLQQAFRREGYDSLLITGQINSVPASPVNERATRRRS